MGVIAAGVITWGAVTLYNRWKASAASQHRTLSDTKASIPNGRVYYMAYVNKSGELIKVGNAMNFVEAIASLGISGATNTLNVVYKYPGYSITHNVVKNRKDYNSQGNVWGIYTNSQASAKALAVVFGCTGKPEVEGSGMYGHYHNGGDKHIFHIWFGGKITY